MKKNLKDKITNVCGVIVLIAGSILALPTSGVSLPPAVITASTIALTIAGSMVAYLTGKGPDGNPKQ
jgi:hypothetical protein